MLSSYGQTEMQWNTLVNSQITPIAKHNGIRVLAFGIIANGAC